MLRFFHRQLDEQPERADHMARSQISHRPLFVRLEHLHLGSLSNSSLVEAEESTKVPHGLQLCPQEFYSLWWSSGSPQSLSLDIAL
ncbi:unnamed protein product [Nippostrongylus brasiliensis]|uniref:Uncharacterized protein n=1 Tax=Nippostrongylus brasiliensis TaxID=27835 RepID=A0A0N4XTJ4_NIPBR|nr:unnamed protein product [Nippostrongylus brasiliensis]